MKCFYSRMSKREGNLIVNNHDVTPEFLEKLKTYVLKIEGE